MPCLLLGKTCPYLFKELVICLALSFMYFECYFWGSRANFNYWACGCGCVWRGAC